MTYYPAEAKDDSQGEFWDWLHANYTVYQIDRMHIQDIIAKREAFYR